MMPLAVTPEKPQLDMAGVMAKLAKMSPDDKRNLQRPYLQV